MKFKINRNNKVPLIAIIIIALLLVVGGGAYVYATYLAPSDPASDTSQTQKPSGTVDYDKATDEQKDAGTDQKDQTNGGTKDPSSVTPSGSNLGVIVTYLEQVDDTIKLSSQIDAVSNDGQCTLVLTHGSTVVTKQAGIQAQAKVSTCKGFTIPTSELAVGTWQAKLTVKIGDRQGDASKSFTVQ